MKVYVVTKYDFCWKETYMLGAFSSQELAMDVVEKEIAKGGEWFKLKTSSSREQKWIDTKGSNSGTLIIYEEELQGEAE